jgi:DNA repair protein RadD
MELRDIQVPAVKAGVEFFKSKKTQPSIIVAPTAFGKSIVIAFIAKEVDEKILVIQPSKELLKQNYNKFINLGGEAEIYSSSLKSKNIGKVTYATIGSIIKVAYQFKEMGFTKVIIDECDRYPKKSDGMLRTFITNSGMKWILGLTATPLKLESEFDKVSGDLYSKLAMLTTKTKNGSFFKDIIHVCQISEMIENKYWTPLVYESYDFDTGQLVYNSNNSDFTEKSIINAFNNQNILEKIVKKTALLTDKKSILISVPTIEAALELEKRIPSCRAVYSGMSDGERDSIIDQFKSLTLRVVAQVSILSVGFDHPELDCIITGRPTASLSWWYQFVGRVTRIHPSKKVALVVDFVGSVTKFGKIEDLIFKKTDSGWKLYGEGKKQITDIPIPQIGLYIEGEKTPLELAQSIPNHILSFGKYAGKPIRSIPSSYRNWLIDNYYWNRSNLHIKEALVNLQRLKL